MFKVAFYTALLASALLVHEANMGQAGETLFEQAAAQEQAFFGTDKYFSNNVNTLPDIEKDIECMALNIYHEARNENYAGQKAVAFVVMNRVNSELFPNSVCEVVYQGRVSKWHRDNTGKEVPLRNQCQFSWYCDGKPDTVHNPAKFQEAREIAFRVITQYNSLVDNTYGALWYHASYVSPKWRHDYDKTVKIETHIFYKERS